VTSCQKDEEEIDIIDFEELELDMEPGYWNGKDRSGEFRSGNASFPNYWDDTWGEYWEGFSYSNRSDNATPGIGNQYSSFAGGGAEGSEQYALFYSGFYGTDTLVFTRPERVNRMSVSNSAYAALAMQDGDDFTKKFGGESGGDPDWFSLIIEGIDTDGKSAGTIEIYLADFRPDIPENDFIRRDWVPVPLDQLGVVKKLVFGFASSDTSYGFINVPTYVCIDNIVGTLK
jgi:hypothetical protein